MIRQLTSWRVCALSFVFAEHSLPSALVRHVVLIRRLDWRHYVFGNDLKVWFAVRTAGWNFNTVEVALRRHGKRKDSLWLNRSVNNCGLEKRNAFTEARG
jgi:hypothetical protein